MTSSIETVRAFCDSFRSRDAAITGSFLADDAIWENVPIGVTSGRAAIAGKLADIFGKTSDMGWEILAIADDGQGRVLTERVDRFRLQGRLVELRLMGVFAVKGGKIIHWRDYFDLASYQAQLGGGAWTVANQS